MLVASSPERWALASSRGPPPARLPSLSRTRSLAPAPRRQLPPAGGRESGVRANGPFEAFGPLNLGPFEFDLAPAAVSYVGARGEVVSQVRAASTRRQRQSGRSGVNALRGPVSGSRRAPIFGSPAKETPAETLAS